VRRANGSRAPGPRRPSRAVQNDGSRHPTVISKAVLWSTWSASATRSPTPTSTMSKVSTPADTRRNKRPPFDR
jgi:hypothetical protein